MYNFVKKLKWFRPYVLLSEPSEQTDKLSVLSFLISKYTLWELSKQGLKLIKCWYENQQLSKTFISHHSSWGRRLTRIVKTTPAKTNCKPQFLLHHQRCLPFKPSQKLWQTDRPFIIFSRSLGRRPFQETYSTEP